MISMEHRNPRKGPCFLVYYVRRWFDCGQGSEKMKREWIQIDEAEEESASKNNS